MYQIPNHLEMLKSFQANVSTGGSFCDHKGRFVVRFVRGTIIGLHGCSGGASLGSRGPRQAAHAAGSEEEVVRYVMHNRSKSRQ